MNNYRISIFVHRFISILFIVLIAASLAFAKGHFLNENIVKCEKAGQGIANYVNRISRFETVKMVDTGEIERHNLFDSERVNMDVVNFAFAAIEKSKTDFTESGKNHSKWISGRYYNCYKSGFFMSYAFKIEKDIRSVDAEGVKELYKDIRNLQNDSAFMDWMKGHLDEEGVSDYDRYKKVLDDSELVEFVVQRGADIIKNNEIIKKFKEEYDKKRGGILISRIRENNKLIEENNKLINEVNKSNKDEYKKFQMNWYNSMLDLVDMQLFWQNDDALYMLNFEELS